MGRPVSKPVWSAVSLKLAPDASKALALLQSKWGTTKVATVERVLIERAARLAKPKVEE